MSVFLAAMRRAERERRRVELKLEEGDRLFVVIHKNAPDFRNNGVDVAWVTCPISLEFAGTVGLDAVGVAMELCFDGLKDGVR